MKTTSLIGARAQTLRSLAVSATVAFAACAMWDWSVRAEHAHPKPAAAPVSGDAAAVDHSAHTPSMQSAAVDAVRIEVPTVDLVDQDGKRIRLGRDLLSNRLAVVNFVYTSCTTVCPMQSAVLSQLQRSLGDRLGRSVELVSISVDPTNDRPEQLKRFAQARGAGAGWHWLTGERTDVERALRGFDAYTADYTQHPAMVVVGDPQRGDWSRFYGFPSSHALLARLDELAAMRAAATGPAHHGHHGHQEPHAMHGGAR